MPRSTHRLPEMNSPQLRLDNCSFYFRREVHVPDIAALIKIRVETKSFRLHYVCAGLCRLSLRLRSTSSRTIHKFVLGSASIVHLKFLVPTQSLRWCSVCTDLCHLHPRLCSTSSRVTRDFRWAVLAIC